MSELVINNPERNPRTEDNKIRVFIQLAIKDGLESCKAIEANRAFLEDPGVDIRLKTLVIAIQEIPITDESNYCYIIVLDGFGKNPEDNFYIGFKLRLYLAPRKINRGWCTNPEALKRITPALYTKIKEECDPEFGDAEKTRFSETVYVYDTSAGAKRDTDSIKQYAKQSAKRLIKNYWSTRLTKTLNEASLFCQDLSDIRLDEGEKEAIENFASQHIPNNPPGQFTAETMLPYLLSWAKGEVGSGDSPEDNDLGELID